jgi:hypothetical protein
MCHRLARPVLLALALLAGTSHAAVGQAAATAGDGPPVSPLLLSHLAPSEPPVPGSRIMPLEERRRPVETSRLVHGALAGGIAGATIGAYTGRRLACEEDCKSVTGARRAALTGGAIGSGTLIPLGAAAGNRFRGDLVYSAAASAALGAAGLGLYRALDDTPLYALPAVVVPVSQVVSAVLLERATSRR